MWPNPQETTDMVTFTDEILNGNLHLLYSINWVQHDRNIDLIGANIYNSSRLQVLFKIGVLFRIIHRKTLVLKSVFKKVAGL